MPSAPQRRPAENDESGMADGAIALLCCLMQDDSSVSTVVAALRTAAQALPAGAQLPSTRTLAATHQVGPVTVQKAVRVLVAEGLVESRPGAGNFVARKVGRASAQGGFAWQTTALGSGVPATDGSWGSGARAVAAGTIGLHSTYPAPSLLPTDLVRAAVGRVSRSGVASDAAPAGGIGELRAWFAHELSGEPALDPSDVLVVSGGQAGIAATLAALTRPGDAVVMESPTYWGAIAAARSRGLEIIPIARTPGGIDPDDLDSLLAATRARVVYAQPTFANPTGQTWTGQVRRDVLDVVAAHRAFLVEDDWARDFAIDDAAPAPLAAADPHGHVVCLRSLTKSMSPSLRVGAIAARGPARARIAAAAMANELFTSGLLQHSALAVLRDPGWTRHRRTLRTLLRERRDALAATLRSVGITEFAVPAGGLSLWVRLEDTTSATDVAGRCLRQGLALSPGTEWFPAEPDAQYLRLSYANAEPSRFDEAAQILAAVLDSAPRS